ncbi:MAG TPA: ribosome maturation factor RimM [Burkholderiales bacterium]|nr:ribosome maturation factor RimM [Burkholderiales bacterium]
MGRVAGSYGVRGWLKVAPEGGGAPGLAEAKEWWIGEQAYAVTARIHGATVVGKPEGIATREEALQLKGLPVAVRREALADPGEGHYYHADLMGLEVVNEQGELLGTVKRMFSNGAQDVMEVQGRKTHLVPWVGAIVKDVSLADRRITVAWGSDW